MMHGARDITARKSIEWGEVEKDKDGNRQMRYKFDATIWGKDVYTMNKLFTFNVKGNILNMEDVAGFPKKKAEKPVNVSTQEGMKELVEVFFSQNFRDIERDAPVHEGIQPVGAELDEVEIELLLKFQRQLGKMPGGSVLIGEVPPETERQPIRFLKRQGLLDPLAVGHRPLGGTRAENESPCGREDRGPDAHRAKEMPTTE